MIPQYCTAHPVLRITTRNWQQKIMAAFLAGKLARDKNGRFGKAWLGKRGGNLWQGRKRKLCKSVEIVESAKTSVLTFSKCEFPVTGRRVVELDLLAKELDGGCKSYGKPLRLADCTQETISGLGSFLYITCGEETCGEINVCHTSKVHRANAGTRWSFPLKRAWWPIFFVT